MTPEQFVYWLNGYFEILAPALNDSSLSKSQVQVIKDHLKEVFIKVTPEKPFSLPTPNTQFLPFEYPKYTPVHDSKGQTLIC